MIRSQLYIILQFRTTHHTRTQRCSRFRFRPRCCHACVRTQPVHCSASAGKLELIRSIKLQRDEGIKPAATATARSRKHSTKGTLYQMLFIYLFIHSSQYPRQMNIAMSKPFRNQRSTVHVCLQQLSFASILGFGMTLFCQHYCIPTE